MVEKPPERIEPTPSLSWARASAIWA
ncbi:hypothetical protein A2U01_0086763, partial [Trifolium medium]|nr:hypothetical protein [Trifolium medium]